ncbi:MAG: hypothetical protein J0H74_15125 [Chitinophagaceae bacterium]|nr:hypothetical protein [Chitinophagaceae bacterium]
MTTLKLGLVLHLSGIVLMVGMTIAAFVLQWQLWYIIPYGKERTRPLWRVSKRVNLLQGLGGLLILAGGATMMAALHGVVMHQSWFKLKLVLLGLIILNALVVLMPAGRKLRRLLAGALPEHDETPGSTILSGDLAAIKGRMLLFYTLQLSFFLLIFILSVFQPA